MISALESSNCTAGRGAPPKRARRCFVPGRLRHVLDGHLLCKCTWACNEICCCYALVDCRCWARQTGRHLLFMCLWQRLQARLHCALRRAHRWQLALALLLQMLLLLLLVLLQWLWVWQGRKREFGSRCFTGCNGVLRGQHSTHQACCCSVQLLMALHCRVPCCSFRCSVMRDLALSCKLHAQLRQRDTRAICALPHAQDKVLQLMVEGSAHWHHMPWAVTAAYSSLNLSQWIKRQKGAEPLSRVVSHQALNKAINGL